MRTNIDIDDALMAELMATGDFKTKKQVVETALQRLAELYRQKEILALKGKIRWEGDLDEMRRD